MPNSTSFKPRLVKSPEQQAATYAASLQLVAVIDDNLATGRVHYRTRSGRLLRTLDEVVRAILAGNLMPEREAAVWVPDLTDFLEEASRTLDRQPEPLAA